MFRIFNEDCLKSLKELQSNSVDLVVTDPPYQFGGDGAGAFGNTIKKYRFSLDDCKVVQCSFSKNYYRSMVKCYNF